MGRQTDFGPAVRGRRSERFGKAVIKPSEDFQQARSRRSNARRQASKRTGVPLDLLPLHLGGAASAVRDHPVYRFAGVWHGSDGRPVAGISVWDRIKDLQALEDHIAAHGYPWQPGYTGGD